MQKFTKFFMGIVMFFVALAVNAETKTIKVQWPTDAIDATGAAPIALNDGFYAVGNNSKVTLTKSGFYTGGNSSSSGRHMYFTPSADGVLTVEAAPSGDNSDRYAFVCTGSAGADETASNVIAKVAIPSKGVRQTVDATLVKDTKYFICLHGNGTITNLSFTYEVPAEPAGTEADPIILTAGVPAKGPKAAASATDYTYYKYTATQAGVVTLNISDLRYVMGNMVVGGENKGLHTAVVVAEGDVVTVKLAAQDDCSAKTFTLNIRDLAQGESQANAIALAEGSNNIAAIANGGLPMWYSMTVPAGKEMKIVFDGYPSAKIFANGEEKPVEYLMTESAYTGIYANNTENDVVAYVQVTALAPACTANVTIADATPQLPAITKMGQPVVYANTTLLAPDAVLDAAPNYIRIMFPETDAQPTDVVTANAMVFEVGEDGNPTGAPLNMENYGYTSTVQDGIAISNVQFEAGKKYKVQLSSAGFREIEDLGYRKVYAYEYPNADENPTTITNEINFSVKASSATTFDVDSVMMNWKGEQIAAGAEVEALSYAYAIATDKTIAAGEGRIEFKDAQGTSIAVGALNAEAKTITFMSFGETGYTTPGVYTLVIPAGAIVDAEGNKNNEFTATWTVVGGTHAIDTKIVETEGVYTLTGTWAALGTGKAYLDTEDNTATITLNEGVATISFTAPTEPGNHYLYVQEKAVVDADGNYNGAASLPIIVEGQNTIVADKYVLTAKVEKCVENIPSEFEEFVGVYKTIATLAGEANALTISENSVRGIFDGFVIKGDAVAYSKDLAIVLKGKKFNVRSLDGISESGMLKLTATENGYAMDGASIWYNGIKVATVDSISIEKFVEKTFAIDSVANAKGAAGSEVEYLSYMFTINAASAITGLFEGNITLTDAEGTRVGGNAYVYGYEGNGGATTVYARFAFDTEDHNLHTPGVYTMTIPAGMFVDAEGAKSEAFTATWTIKGQPETSTFAITAATNAGNAAGSEVEALSYMFEINAANAITGLFEGNITLTDSLGNKVGGNATVMGYEGEGGATTVYARFAFDTEDHMLHTAGVYTLNIPAGMFVDAEGNKSEAFTATWTIKEQKQTSTFAITAATNAGNAAGSEVEALSYMFEINAANAITGLFEGNITLTDSLGNKVGGNATVVGYEGDGGATTVYARFAFDTEDHMLHTAGVYTLNIPAGMFVDAEGNKSEAFTATWTIKEQKQTSTFAITAATNAGNAAGSEVEALSYMFEINAANAITGLFEGNITLTDSLGNKVGGNATVVGYEGDGGATTVYARFAFDTEDHMLHTAGVYTLNIPAGMFVDAEGNKSEAFTATWTIKAQPETSTFAIESVTNAAGEGEVEALSYMFTINAANAITGLFEGNITLTDSIGNPVGGYATVMGYEGEGGAKTVYAKFTFDTEDHMLHTAGVYTLNIPAGMFVDAEGNKSEAFTASWTVVPAAHAIDTKIVKSEEGVYTLTGTWATLGTGIAYLDTEDNVATITLDENGVATISFTAPTEPGNHYLYVQENAVVNAEGNFNGATSTVIIVENPSTGIKNVTNAPKANGKYLMNGKIVIVKDNVKYNVSGSMIK